LIDQHTFEVQPEIFLTEQTKLNTFIHWISRAIQYTRVAS
jgi:hypothetical protein